jgi:putative Holliday junction resolvase
MRYLGIDFGQKKIGLASSEGFLATEYGSIEADQNLEQIVDRLSKIIEKEGAEKVIIGLPVSPGSKKSPLVDKVKRLAKDLREKIDVEVILEDETLTSFEAEQILRDEGLTIEEAKRRVDQLSAKLILQQYIEENTQTSAQIDLGM